jgi:hypothetical protein
VSQTPTLTTYTFRVFGGDETNPEMHLVHGVGRDVQRTEAMFAERGWGQTSNRPMTSAAAVSYFAMLRTGAYSGRWEDFEKWYLSIEPEEKVTAFPTDAEHEADS